MSYFSDVYVATLNPRPRTLALYWNTSGITTRTIPTVLLGGMFGAWASRLVLFEACGSGLVRGLFTVESSKPANLNLKMNHALKSCWPRLRTVGVDVHVSQAAPEEFAQSFLGFSYTSLVKKNTLLKEIPTGALSNLPGTMSTANTCLASIGDTRGFKGFGTRGLEGV